MIAFARDDQDEQVIHWQVVAGNRSGRGPARHFRVVLRDIGLKEPITYAVDLGDSAKDVDQLLEPKALPRLGSSSARELILDILDEEGAQESDALDSRLTQETGLAVKTIKNARTKLKDEGLIRVFPDKDKNGEIVRWNVTRTLAPRTSTAGVHIPNPVGNWETNQIPVHAEGGTGLSIPSLSRELAPPAGTRSRLHAPRDERELGDPGIRLGTANAYVHAELEGRDSSSSRSSPIRIEERPNGDHQERLLQLPAPERQRVRQGPSPRARRRPIQRRRVLLLRLAGDSRPDPFEARHIKRIEDGGSVGDPNNIAAAHRSYNRRGGAPRR